MHDRNENFFDTNMLEANVDLKFKSLIANIVEDSSLWDILCSIDFIVPFLW